jgi:3-deoxy-D-manno-octulosonic-acid transferase
METEVWPTMIESCRRASIPAFLINARLSERSAKGYAKHAAFTRPIFAALSGVAAQTKADATRLAAVGANNITVTGNVKFDVAIPSNQQGLGETFRARFGGERRRPIFLAASTREGEETLVLDALSQATLPENAVTVIVPRHPERFKAVAALLKERELAFVTRSQNIDVPDHVKYVIGDSMGEMLAYYLAADIAFVGGSLLPLGGQNLIEPLAAKTPTLIGAHTFNFQEIAQLAVWAGAAVRVESAASLIEEVAVLLNDKDKQNKMIHAGEAFLAEHRGATDRLMSWLEKNRM